MPAPQQSSTSVAKAVFLSFRSRRRRAASPPQAPRRGGHEAFPPFVHELVECQVFAVWPALLFLDDMTLEKGPTRVVPGSHRGEAWPTKEIVNEPIEAEVAVTCPAGSAKMPGRLAVPFASTAISAL